MESIIILSVCAAPLCWLRHIEHIELVSMLTENENLILICAAARKPIKSVYMVKYPIHKYAEFLRPFPVVRIYFMLRCAFHFLF